MHLTIDLNEIEMIATWLERNPPLRELIIRSALIDYDTSRLFEALKLNQTLSILKLGGRVITNKEM